MNYILLIIFLFSSIAFTNAQGNHKTPINPSPRKLVIGLDGRKSFISSQHVTIAGIRIGLQHYDKYRYGIGYYFLTNSNRTGIFPSPIPIGQTVPSNVKFKFHYFAGFFEPIILTTKRWEVSIPLIFGVGSIKQQIGSDADPTINKKNVMLVEPSIMATLKIFKWLGLGIGVGQREMLFSNEVIRKNFNSPIYIAKIRIHYWQIAKEGNEKIRR